MPKWEVKLVDGSSEVIEAQRLFVTMAGHLSFTHLEGKYQIPWRGIALGEWKQFKRVLEDA